MVQRHDIDYHEYSDIGSKMSEGRPRREKMRERVSSMVHKSNSTRMEKSKDENTQRVPLFGRKKTYHFCSAVQEGDIVATDEDTKVKFGAE